MVLGTPSPVLFSSDDQAFPQGEEEIGYLNQDGAGGEGAKDKSRGFAAEDPGAGSIAPWLRFGIRMKETSASVVPPKAFTVRIEVQGTPFETV